MRMIRGFAALCLALMMLCAPALAEAPFLMYAKDWTLDGVPVSVNLSARITSHMPFDEDRLAMLAEVTDNLSLYLTAGDNEGSVTISVGGTDALTLAYRGNAIQLSTIPEMTFATASDPMEMMLGIPVQADTSVYGLRADAETLLDDGWVLLSGLGTALEAYADRRSVKTNITDMGTARSCTDYTVPKGDVEALKDTLLHLCPEGWLHEIIEGLTFSGKQTLRVYRTEDEVPLRMEYNGVCGAEGDLRTVKLIWKMRRDEVAHRDLVTLTSPAKSGTNKNTLEFERSIQTNKAGAITMEGSFTYTVTADKQTTTRKGTFDLTNAFTDEADVLSGSFTLQQKLPGEDGYAGLTLAPEVVIAGTQENPVITGSIGVKGLDGKNVLEQAEIRLTLMRCDTSCWTERENVLDLDTLTEEELALLQQDVLSGAATALVRPLIILMGDRADWFFQDMSPEAIQRVEDAARQPIFE